MNRPLVSVCIISYNQEAYISEAVQGVLDQKTDSFELEIVVGDDCSSDSTLELLKQFQMVNPSIIRFSERTVNLGMHRNWEQTIMDCKGDFIAILEGDDRWDDPLKLEKQVNLLQLNPNASACFSNAKVLLEHGTFSAYDYVDRFGKDLSSDTFFELNFNPIPTCTTLFRAERFQGFPQAYYSSPFADWILHSILIQKGPYVYLNETSSSYRKHDGGVWSGIRKEKQLKNKLRALQIIENLVELQLKGKVRNAQKLQLHELLYFYRKEGEKLKYLITWLKLKLA